jgi:hypothetical protein
LGKDNRQEEVRTGKHRERTEMNLALGGFAIITVVGGALMLITLGAGPASIGLGAIMIVFGVFLLLYWSLGLLERWLRRG